MKFITRCIVEDLDLKQKYRTISRQKQKSEIHKNDVPFDLCCCGCILKLDISNKTDRVDL